MFSAGTFDGREFPANSDLGRLNGDNLEVPLDWGAVGWMDDSFVIQVYG